MSPHRAQSPLAPDPAPHVSPLHIWGDAHHTLQQPPPTHVMTKPPYDTLNGV